MMLHVSRRKHQVLIDGEREIEYPEGKLSSRFPGRVTRDTGYTTGKSPYVPRSLPSKYLVAESRSICRHTHFTSHEAVLPTINRSPAKCFSNNCASCQRVATVHESRRETFNLLTLKLWTYLRTKETTGQPVRTYLCTNMHAWMYHACAYVFVCRQEHSGPSALEMLRSFRVVNVCPMRHCLRKMLLT